MRQLMMRYEGGRVAAPSPGAGIVVRSYENADHDELMRVLVPLTGADYDAEKLDRDILSHRGVKAGGIFLAELDGRAVGTVTGYTHEADAEHAADEGGTLHMVSVLKEASGRGVGRAVCAAAMNYLVDLGCTYIDLTTDDFRLPAVKIYTELGFRAVIDGEEMQNRWAKVYSDTGMPDMLGEAYGRF